MAGANTRILRESWRIARPYWFSEERWLARGLLTAVIAMNFAGVWITVRINTWQKAFYNTLQNYDEAGFFHQIGLFIVLAGAYIVLLVIANYLQQFLQIRWRLWMTEVYLREWLSQKIYYRLQLIGDATDNPDQRISEDLNLFPQQSLNLFLGLLTNIVQAVSFSFILWDLSGPLTVPLGRLKTIAIPGYMFWGVLLYTGAATWLAMRTGRPLIDLNFAQQRFEADFRFSLVRLRENCESVAFYGGETRENKVFGDRFANVYSNFKSIMYRTLTLGFVQAGSGQAAVVFPYLIAAPKYFLERMSLGSIQEIAGAFIQLQGSLAWIINSYNDIANWEAVVHRLATFRNEVDSIHAALNEPQPIAIRREGQGLTVADLELDLPDGRLLRQGIKIDVAPGEAILIEGPTGTGKSTFLRAIAGIWPFGHGQIRLDKRRAFFLPQKPYTPLGSLRDALLYPDEGTGVTREKLVEVLGAVGLGHLTGALDDVDLWSQRLSGGEQQRLAFARVLLADPGIIFLDEATASLDEHGQSMLYRLLRDLPSHPTIISVGHRPTLREFHDRVLDLALVQDLR